jgi:hypothetical protein
MAGTVQAVRSSVTVFIQNLRFINLSSVAGLADLLRLTGMSNIHVTGIFEIANKGRAWI